MESIDWKLFFAKEKTRKSSGVLPTLTASNQICGFKGKLNLYLKIPVNYTR